MTFPQKDSPTARPGRLGEIYRTKQKEVANTVIELQRTAGADFVIWATLNILLMSGNGQLGEEERVQLTQDLLRQFPKAERLGPEPGLAEEVLLD